VSGQRLTLTRVVNLENADSFIPGWEQAVLVELREMRRLIPQATTLELRLERVIKDG
jgi:hypothetical protein